MHSSCQALGLAVSLSKTENLVTVSGIRYVGQHLLPYSNMLLAFAKLAKGGKGAAAHVSAKHTGLMCSKPVSMVRRLLNTHCLT